MDNVNQRGGELIVIRPEDHWAKVDRRIIDDERLTLEARGVLAWIATRPESHRLFVGYLQKRCGIKQTKWQRLRRELESLGYLSTRRINVSGKFAWQYHVNLVYQANHRCSTTDGGVADKLETERNRERSRSHPPPASAPQALGGGVSPGGGGVGSEKGPKPAHTGVFNWPRNKITPPGAGAPGKGNACGAGGGGGGGGV
jgi:hypothetical protein